MTKKVYDLWVFLCLISPAAFCSFLLVDPWRFPKSTWSLDRQVTWKSRWGLSTLPSLVVIGVVKLEVHIFANIAWSHDRWFMWLDGCGQLISHLAKSSGHCPSEGEDKVFLKITWLHDQWITWLLGLDTLTLNHKGYSNYNRTQSQKYICITNWGKPVLQIGAAFFYYKLRQTLLQIEAASLLQIGPSLVTNWGSHYKLG